MCEWCGAGIDKKLTVHHERELKSITYEIFWIRMVNAAINKYLEENEGKKTYCEVFIERQFKNCLIESKRYYEERAKTEDVECYPHCNSTNLIKRKTKKPVYKCNICKKEFNKLNIL